MSSAFALIIEDDYDAAIIFAKSLEAAAFETEIVRDGQEALDRLAEVVPDVVVLDLHLPHVAGRDILNHIRADERLSSVRVLVASADPQASEYLQDIADLILLKPVSFTQMRDLAKRLKPADSE